MSVSKSWVANEKNTLAVLTLYRDKKCLTLDQIAEELGTTFQNVQWVLKTRMPTAEYEALKKIRYSLSKSGEKCPMYGRTGSNHPNWKGEVDDGYGYLTCLKDGKRQFVHRIVMAEAIGVKELPESLAVHHIDGNPKNNKLDNLALVTDTGHKQLHFLQAKDSLSVMLKRSTLLDTLKYMTSQ